MIEEPPTDGADDGGMEPIRWSQFVQCSDDYLEDFILIVIDLSSV